MRARPEFDIPKEFLEVHYGPDSTPEGRKDFEKRLKTKREIIKGEPAFNSINEAINNAVNTLIQQKDHFPSVWREPKDIGKRYVVVSFKNRENAYVAGYKEVVDDQKIYDIANGNRRDRTGEAEEIKEI